MLRREIRTPVCSGIAASEGGKSVRPAKTPQMKVGTLTASGNAVTKKDDVSLVSTAKRKVCCLSGPKDAAGPQADHHRSPVEGHSPIPAE